MRKIARTAFTVFATFTGLILLWQFSVAVLLLVLSLVVASALRPSLNGWIERGLSRKTALVYVYALLVLFIAGFFILFSQALVNDLQQFADDFVTRYERIKMDWPRGGTLFQRSLADQLPPTEDFYSALSSEEGIASVLGVLGAAQNVLAGLVLAAITIVLSMYWSADENRFERLSLWLLPDAHRGRARRVWASIEAGVGGHVRGEILQSVLAGIILGLGFWITGMRYPALLAFWVAGVRLIPWFGCVLAIFPPLVAIIVGAPAAGISISIAILAVLLVLKATIEPRFFNRKRYNALWILVSILSFAEMWGVVGAILAPTFAIAAQLLTEQLFPRPAVLHRPLVLDRIETLHARISDLDRRVQRNGEKLPQGKRKEIERLRTWVDALTARSGD